MGNNGELTTCPNNGKWVVRDNRRFIKDFGRICKPLDRLTGNVPWQWGLEEQAAFDTLKERFTQNPVLCLYDPNRDTRIEVDASGYATGGVLAQLQDDGKWHPIAYCCDLWSSETGTRLTSRVGVRRRVLCSESGVRLDAQGWRQVALTEVSTKEIQQGSPGDKRSKLSLQVVSV